MLVSLKDKLYNITKVFSRVNILVYRKARIF